MIYNIEDDFLNDSLQKLARHLAFKWLSIYFILVFKREYAFNFPLVFYFQL